ncbi:hypothetical protein DEDE109153_13125 [Deinococcus deserti]|uniref:Uncharacterized protein n=1 Tax=Deinococcus deserti (strain DSM 17065 / CIP 109153 / LMG 22923 / VCD115) TaxID=546414 RepID=C1CZ51_DEIDV|nr:Hypothetical protein Deide_02774 [Deinococcus deserti VCD115]
MTSLRRRVNRVSDSVQSEWLASWDVWCVRLVRLWRQYDADGRAHHALALSVEQRWASLVSDEETAEFLAWGEARAAELYLPAGLWTWFWQEAYGARLRGDIRVWPQTTPCPPTVSPGQLRSLVSKVMVDDSDPAMSWALVMAALAAAIAPISKASAEFD